MSEPKKLNKAVCVESKEDSTSYEIDLPIGHHQIVYHLREADLAVAQDMLNTIIDSAMGIDEQKVVLDLVIGCLQRIGGLELTARQDKIEIHNLMREVTELDQHLNPVFEGAPYGADPAGRS